MRRETIFVTLSVCITIVAASAIIARGGPLDPPNGPVTPTYKTLAQVEPRIPIGPDTTPGDNGQVGAGVFASGNDSRIEGNTLNQNDMGHDINGCKSVIIRNSARGNGANYANVAGCNHLGAVVTKEAAMNNAANANVNWSF